jgi:hypothetical protein
LADAGEAVMLTDGKSYEPQILPTIFFGRTQPVSYVLNAKVMSTLAMNFIFFVNHNYRYFDPPEIYHSQHALARIEGSELDPRVLKACFALSPESFSIVRNPLRRFISGFLSKAFTAGDTKFYSFREMLTTAHGIDLSPEADPRQSCLAFAKWIASRKNLKRIDQHFRPQHLNLTVGSRFKIDTILRFEDQESILAFFAKWTTPEKAKWLLSIRMNEQTKFTPDQIVSDELKDVVREIYALDYELFYP